MTQRPFMMTEDEYRAALRSRMEAAIALVADPKTWTTGDAARRADGSGTWSQDPAATCFCAIGAIGRACGGHRTWAEPKLLDALREEVEHRFGIGTQISNVNDHRGRETILDCMKSSLERLP